MQYLRRIFVLTLVLAWSGTAFSQQMKFDPKDSRNNPKIVQAFRDVVKKPSEATVRVLLDGKEVALGAVVDGDNSSGWIITKWDHLQDGKTVTCKVKDGREFTAKIVGAQTEYDLALLRIEATGLPKIEWRPSADAKVGRWVASVGLGEDPAAIGVISVGTRELKPGDQPAKNINVNAGYMGVGLESDPAGAKVNKVEKSSPAEKAALKINDVIYEAAGRTISDPETLINTVGRLKAGDKVLLKFKRGDDDKEVTLTLGVRPKAFGTNPQELMGSLLSNRRGGFPFILQHDTVLKPNDCGGPLVDLDGKTVGINIARAGRTESYAIPSEKVIALLVDLKSGKLAPKLSTVAAPPEPAFLVKATSSLSDKDSTDKKLPGRFVKVHEVEMNAGTAYLIELQSAKFDAYLVVQDSAGKKLAEDNDSGGGLNAKLLFRAPNDGKYRVVVTSFNANETGSYTLTVRKQEEKK